jgi:hypothetical protein
LKKKKWFQTDLVYIGTTVKIRKSPDVAYSYDNLGRFTFGIYELKDVKIQVTSKGKLGLFYPEGLKYQEILKLIKNLLINANNEPAKIIDEIKIKDDNEQKNFARENVEKAIGHLIFLLLRNPTSEEIGYEIGETPEKVREVAFKLAPKLGWKEPLENEIKEAKLRIKEIYQTASLSQKFGKPIVFTRPVKYLGGRSWKDILQRVDYALKYESEKIPAIKENEETEERLEFEFVWSRGSDYFGGYPEYYDKKKKQLSGDVFLRETFKKATADIKKLIEEAKEER